MPRSTVGVVLRRLGLNRLSALEPKPEIVRDERAEPSELIHLDIKSLGQINGICGSDQNSSEASGRIQRPAT